jgi:hypothetical protein
MTGEFSTDHSFSFLGENSQALAVEGIYYQQTRNPDTPWLRRYKECPSIFYSS